MKFGHIYGFDKDKLHLKLVSEIGCLDEIGISMGVWCLCSHPLNGLYF
jgi:hypothetical protein